MSNARFFGVKRALTLLSLPVFAACSSAQETASADTLPLMPSPGTNTDSGSTQDGGVDGETPETPDNPDASPGDPETPDAEAPDSSTPTEPSKPVPWRGINLSVAEWGIGVFPGTLGKEYTWPTAANVDYYMSKGMNTFRIPFAWERLQPKANGAFDAKYAEGLDTIVNYAVSKGANVIIDPHNYARYYGGVVGSTSVPNSVFADLWTRLATKYASNPHIFFNLVNEPHDIQTEQWASAANAAIAAIRATGANNVIMVPGNQYTGAWAWTSGDIYGTSNAVALLNIVDPLNNVVFEAHQYLDGNSSGTSSSCVSTTIGSERLAGWIKWLRDNGKKGFLGEFAGGNNATCNAAVTDMLNTMMSASDVIMGFTWWAGGPWWGNYMFALDPSNGQDKPQMSILSPFLRQ
ncbi:Endoglucanase [Labilithrix luteola]|uniref:Endoglucanase n=1 Tax=Labilithrix luteola TaxID=1391654 RepID=A0A0K1PW41_9BACT|nr:glycoside hydrolase family 5 protein [Labilithrix luteola]AKU97732.1 Endoglucanase [Labilithrix luteola]